MGLLLLNYPRVVELFYDWPVNTILGAFSICLKRLHDRVQLYIYIHQGYYLISTLWLLSTDDNVSILSESPPLTFYEIYCLTYTYASYYGVKLSVTTNKTILDKISIIVIVIVIVIVIQVNRRSTTFSVGTPAGRWIVVRNLNIIHNEVNVLG